MGAWCKESENTCDTKSNKKGNGCGVIGYRHGGLSRRYHCAVPALKKQGKTYTNANRVCKSNIVRSVPSFLSISNNEFKLTHSICTSHGMFGQLQSQDQHVRLHSEILLLKCAVVHANADTPLSTTNFHFNFNPLNLARIWLADGYLPLSWFSEIRSALPFSPTVAFTFSAQDCPSC